MGRQLLAAAETHARQVECSGVLISVISVRSELIAWYERLGFLPTGETADFPAEALSVPKQKLNMLLMRKRL